MDGDDDAADESFKGNRSIGPYLPMEILAKVIELLISPVDLESFHKVNKACSKEVKRVCVARAKALVIFHGFVQHKNEVIDNEDERPVKRSRKGLDPMREILKENEWWSCLMSDYKVFTGFHCGYRIDTEHSGMITSKWHLRDGIVITRKIPIRGPFASLGDQTEITMTMHKETPSTEMEPYTNATIKIAGFRNTKGNPFFYGDDHQASREPNEGIARLIPSGGGRGHRDRDDDSLARGPRTNEHAHSKRVLAVVRDGEDMMDTSKWIVYAETRDPSFGSTQMREFAEHGKTEYARFWLPGELSAEAFFIPFVRHRDMRNRYALVEKVNVALRSFVCRLINMGALIPHDRFHHGFDVIHDDDDDATNPFLEDGRVRGGQ
jgi:hypothetical protein